MPSGTNELESRRSRREAGEPRRPVVAGRDEHKGAVVYAPAVLAAAIVSTPAQRSVRPPRLTPRSLRPSPRPATTLALIGGQRLLREATASLLTAQCGLDVRGTFESVTHYLASGWESPPEVLLLDCDGGTPEECRSAVEALRAPGRSRIVMLCRETGAAAVRCAIEYGVSGVLLKSYSAQDVQAALAYTATGRTVLPAGWQRVVDPQANGRSALSPRHRQILALIAQGQRNEEIARELALSPNTIKFHVRALYSRMGVRNRVEAANRYAQMTSGSA